MVMVTTNAGTMVTTNAGTMDVFGSLTRALTVGIRSVSVIEDRPDKYHTKHNEK
jgi:hypothetical protein